MARREALLVTPLRALPRMTSAEAYATPCFADARRPLFTEN